MPDLRHQQVHSDELHHLRELRRLLGAVFAARNDRELYQAHTDLNGKWAFLQEHFPVTDKG